MTRQQRYFERIAEYRERFRKLPTETIRLRLAHGSLITEAAIALREVLEERGEGEAPRSRVVRVDEEVRSCRES